MGESGNRLSAEGGSVRFVAARNIRFGHRPRDSRLRGNDVMGDWNDVMGVGHGVMVAGMTWQGAEHGVMGDGI